MKPLPAHPAEALVLAKLPDTVIDRARQIRLMIFDVDGVLTDGGLWYGEQGEALKRFHVLDGHGLKMLDASGIDVAIITARDGPIVAWRCAELGIRHVRQGVRDKAQALNELAQELGIPKQAVGYMGDDVIDLPAMQQAGLAVTVPNAPAYMAQSAHWTTSQTGGNGAVRECCDVILAAQHKLAPFLMGSTVGAGVIQ
ncbi:KdsC family phosphatase [Orrella daihaiensis]|uniref:3-deoxy-D-manno-octulosonate 8-phosphate phosphatase KdsC n=1 Tax=Orrella daihaiensis TaxID=2782176 RepID=A0ABY4AK54_9BURK|nr:HAD hydrolase family protein [Orrella daihaiensis]UOD50661.1 HAD hydrolase family protein [Orrella daihaiensis]